MGCVGDYTLEFHPYLFYFSTAKIVKKVEIWKLFLLIVIN